MSVDSTRAHQVDEPRAHALMEGVASAERFFMGESEVQKALVKVCAALDADRIPYALAGAMALNAYGYRRVTTDVTLLLTRDGIEAFKRRHVGRGWVERFPGSKGLRDTEFNVKIDVIVTGDYPGDGRRSRSPTPASRGGSAGSRCSRSSTSSS